MPYSRQPASEAARTARGSTSLVSAGRLGAGTPELLSYDCVEKALPVTLDSEPASDPAGAPVKVEDSDDADTLDTSEPRVHVSSTRCADSEHQQTNLGVRTLPQWTSDQTRRGHARNPASPTPTSPTVSSRHRIRYSRYWEGCSSLLKPTTQKV